MPCQYQSTNTVKLSSHSFKKMRWLNPLFKKGHEEKLRVEHIPSIPYTETSSLLEDVLRGKNTSTFFIPYAILQMIWRPLAYNAVFAGVNTIASYIGPLLITSFVNFLSEKKDESNWQEGMILAFIFFFAKTVESLSQRQWYFGAHRIGVRVRAALMALIYKRTLSMKYGSTKNGKIVNFINFDVERIGDFCWHIHGVWLLPVQVTFALLILYRNLGAAPSVAALFSTIFVMSTFLKKLLQLRENERETPLTSRAVLSALATFRILQEPIYNLPELISMVAQTKVSVDRIQDFMREEDQMKLTSCHTPDTSEVVIELEPGEYAWDTNESKKSTIKITEKIRIMKGWKVAICGSVGSGKSSLICSIMGEIPRISGSSINLNGSKAFVPQSAWIQTGTVRDNVLFGKEMHKAHYDGVVDQCALKRDIEMWADGDLNSVGERGMNLSGGQKQRIQLARAIYSDSDIYLLDDPFSAVDAQTGAHMFKAIVYATHQLEFLDASDLILVMKDGRIVQSGKYSELIADPDVLLCQVLFQGLQMASNYWIAWGTEEEGRVTSKRLIGIFVLLSGGSSFFILGRAVMLSTIAIETSQKLYIGMMKSLFREPLSFFDSTPSSRILNRSSTDQSTVDTDIPYRLAGLAFALIQLSSIVVLMSNVAWQIMFLFLLILAISVWYQAYYITTARELARMVGIQKAPILHHFSESPTGLAGLAATYGLNLNVLQAWVIWNLCNVENKMISVERILQFSDVPSEAPLIIEKSRPKPDWPLKGRIDIKNLHVQYSPDLPRVLKGITCTFPEGKKIGVVGRTGSGKSTLIQSLFRVVESSEGCILIDGIDISKIGLQDLRSKLCIIPQDPTLFQGTIRINLDPLQQHTDQDIWEVLHKCHLADIVKQDTRLLDAPVAEEGENLSVGQRQIVCLAKVLLQKRRILVLDEATASVDTETDNVIKKTIREETNGCTVITVAHRIPTVIDNDLVLVLGEGKILEFDTPNQLLKNSSSAFSNLVAEFLGRSSRE
ncbi:hypothetical protein KY285_025413 [Solanum tuberosum]|nr:hypothetical protein KY289_025685 [Solanum tuberosum]KAH0677612.1 hypothetical protein KY285_025413 [Solanum tuberosum]